MKFPSKYLSIVTKKEVAHIFGAAVLSLTMALVSGCQWFHPKKTADSIAQSDSETVGGHTVVKGEAVVFASVNQVNRALATSGINYSVEDLDASPGAKLSPDNLTALRIRTTGGVSVAAMLETLDRAKLKAEPNFVVHASNILDWPRDPEFFKLWAMNNIGQSAPNGLEGASGADIKAVEAWKVTTGSKGIIVGVVDTGVDYEHPDLKDNIFVNTAEQNGVPGVDDDGNGFIDDLHGWNFVSAPEIVPPANGGAPGTNDPMDKNGHGTHCSGTIGGVGNNGIGVTGVNWHVRILPLRFLDDQGSGSTVDAYRAINYGVKMGANVLSNSWGGGGSSELLDLAVKRAKTAGVLFVAAAGNDSSDNDVTDSFPANIQSENVVSVGASDNNDSPAYFSNYGTQKVHVFAPGVNILSTIPSAIAGPSAPPYAVFSGTSMATPHVAGLAALMMASDPSLVGNPVEVKRRLILSSDPVPALIGRSASGGRINMLRAVKNQLNAIDPLAGLTEQPYSYTSPAFVSALTDVRHVVSKPGATAVRAHLNFVQVDEPYDSLYVYDQTDRLVAHVNKTTASDYWTPLVAGESLKIRFVNSKVRQVDYVPQTFATPEDGFAAGASLCMGRADGKFDCYVPGAAHEFANFNSEGFSIDKIAFSTVTP